MLHANQLQFNLDVPTVPENMQTEFTSPSAILFERIYRKDDPSTERKNGNPVKLSAVSSARLSKAMQLAKRDLRLAKRRKAMQNFANESEISLGESVDGEKPTKSSHSQTSRKVTMCLLPVQQTTVKLQRKPASRHQQHKNSPQKISKHDQEILDIRRLRLELQQLILKLERNIEDQRELHIQKLLSFDQEEEQRLVVRHLEQMRKSSRTVYTLQQQTQVIKEDLKRLSTRKVETANKGRAQSRLAAAHRGAVRLFQVYSTQLPEHLIFNDNFVAVSALYQEVARLIKELSLCSLQLDLANVEDVERITDALKNTEPIYTQPPRQTSSPKGRQARPAQKRPRTPQKSFKSKQFAVVKKSPVRPKFVKPAPVTPTYRLPIPEPLQHQNHADLFDRPEWRPPSNSPYMNVGPPPLSPFLESPAPMPSRHLKPKQVTFFSTPKEESAMEHDIDVFQQGTPRDIRLLKSKLADELEAEIKNRIHPLLKKVESLTKSVETSGRASSKPKPKTTEEEILENQVREIIDETKQEMKSFHKQQEIENEAIRFHQTPSLESLMLRLDTISKEEESIRRRWKEINYEDMRPEGPTVLSSEKPVPKTPQPINFTKTGCHERKDSPKRIVNFVPKEDKMPDPKPLVLIGRAERKPRRDPEFFGRTLILPQSTLNAIKKNKRDYERHLKFTFHEPKGKFDPWKLVEELSDNILDEVVSSVSREMNGLCEDYANEIFQREFANASLSSEPSIMTSESSSSVMETPVQKR